MAQKIPIGTDQYFVNFQGGQGLAGGASSYVTYAIDEDTNFVLLRDTINVLVDEVNGIQGPNSVLPLDLMVMDATGRPNVVPEQRSGIIGKASYANTIQANPNENRLDVDPGAALISGLRGVQTTPVTLTAIDQGVGPETNVRFLAVDAFGVPFLEIQPGQRALDLYRFDFATPSQVLSNPVRLAEILNDGDDYELQRKRRGTVPRFDFNEEVAIAAGTPSTLERTVGSWITDGFAVGQLVTVSGAADPDNDVSAQAITVLTATLMSFANGTFSTAQAASQGIRVTSGIIPTKDFDSVHERIEVIEDALAGGTGPDGERIVFGDGSAADPGIRFESEPTGLYLNAPSQIDVAVNGTPEVRITQSQTLHQSSVAAQPGVSFIVDGNTGMYGAGGDILGFATGGVEAMTLNDSGQRRSPTQGRVAVTASAFSLATGAASAIDFAAEEYDVGGFWVIGSPSDILVPTVNTTDFDGLYILHGQVLFDESTSGGTPNTGERSVQLAVNGTPVGLPVNVNAAAAGDTGVPISMDVDLVNGDVVTLLGGQNSGGAMDVAARCSVRLAE